VESDPTKTRVRFSSIATKSNGKKGKEQTGKVRIFFLQLIRVPMGRIGTFGTEYPNPSEDHQDKRRKISEIFLRFFFKEHMPKRQMILEWLLFQKGTLIKN